jgi:hypothetical protein
MSEQETTNYDDGTADAWAAVAVITIVVGIVVYWLAGLPG